MTTVTSGKSIYTTGATSGARTAYPSLAPVFTPGFSGVRVAQSVAFCLYVLCMFCVCFVDRCLYFCHFPFDHYVVCSLIYGF